MKSRLKFLSLVVFSSFALSGCSVDLGFIKIGDNPSETSQSSGAYDKEKDAKRIETYYQSIDTASFGDRLLTALRTLNLSNRTKQVTYTSMSTSASGMFKYTDYDPATVKFTSEGVPYGTKISSFYSGKITTTFNREHVWPNSRSGNLVEDDILMTRPTVTEENSDRGNSAYVTGMCTEHDGWDPVTAFGDTIGVAPNIRGECARIIFYCMTASNQLVLNDNAKNEGNNMAKLTDMITWACENPVTERELRRNVGAQYLQGNRNAFVDHPEYACKIWGNTNESTRSACQKANYSVN